MLNHIFIKKYRLKNALFLLVSICWISYCYTLKITTPILLWAGGCATIAIGGYIQNFYDDNTQPIKNYQSFLWFTIGNIFLIILAYITQQWLFSSSGILASVMLYFYSARLKKHGLIGNLTVALLTSWAFIGLALLLALIANVTTLSSLLILSFFAFTTTLSREWIKDIEDLEEDKLLHRNTLPMLIGIKKTYLLNFLLNLIIVVYLLFHNSNVPICYYVLLALLCITLLAITIYFSFSASHATKHQSFIKLFQALMILLWPLFTS